MSDESTTELASTANRTEADAVAELVASPSVFHRDVEAIYVTVPPGWEAQALDLSRHLPRPTRTRGTVRVHTAASFVSEVKGRSDPESCIVYADAPRNGLTAILNDDIGGPGWRDYRLELDLERTPAWKAWRDLDGKMVAQEAFAEHVEDNLRTITAPTGATMLDIAQTFHATTSASFKSAQRLRSGETQLVYEEDVNATAGAGELVIPELIEITVEPFYGAPPMIVEARLRYRLARSGGVAHVTLGYKLDDPDDRERGVFEDIVKGVRDQLPDVRVVDGEAPAPTRPAAG